MSASRIRALVVCRRCCWRCGSPGSWKRAIWLRPSSLARYIAWSAATSTASAPISRSPPNIVMPTLIVALGASGAGAALSATWARRSSPSCSAPAVSLCGISTANSSPERRATMSVVRTRSRMIPAMRRIRHVARMVAERVVDRLEAVDVDDHHRALATVASGEGDVLIELGAEAAAVEQAGERIMVGDVAELRPRSSRPARAPRRRFFDPAGASLASTDSIAGSLWIGDPAFVTHRS